MSTVHGTMLGFTMAIGALACSAQNVNVPFRQIEKDAQMSAKLEAPGNEPAAMRSYGLSAASSSSSALVLEPPAVKPPRTLSAGFFVLNGLHLGMAVFDVEMTQHCIADNHCHEGNPMMPSSAAGQFGVNFAFVGLGSFTSYKLKKQDSRLWVLSPIIGIAAHAVGVASGFENR